MLGLREDSVVADLGAGTGFYTIAAAKIASNGRVYAIEVQKDYVTTIRNKIKEEDLDNVDVFWGDIEKVGGTKLADGIVDGAVVSNVFSQLEDKNNFISEVQRILKKNGMVLFVDWSPAPSKAGDFILSPNKKGLLSKDKIRDMFEAKGFVFVRDVDTEPHHYGMILKYTPRLKS